MNGPEYQFQVGWRREPREFMSAQPLHLRELVAAREDPRMLLLDIRAVAERAELSIENPFWPVLYSPHDELPQRACAVARLAGGRHVVVVDAFEARAHAGAELLCELEVEAAALEDGVSGWSIALVEESVETHDGVQVVAMRRAAVDLHSYIVAECGDAIVVNPSGSVDCFMAEFSRHGCRPVAVVDTGAYRDARSCSRALASTTGAEYCATESGKPPSEALRERIERSLARLDMLARVKLR